MSHAADTVSLPRHNLPTMLPYRVDLAGLHALCAINYARLMQIFPAMSVQASLCIAIEGLNQQPCAVLLRVCEQSRYTTLLEITSQAHNSVSSPLRWLGLGMQVRVYHDAQMAEVVASQSAPREAGHNLVHRLTHRNFQPKYDYPNQAMYQPDEKHQMNCLLGEWLAYCLAHGVCTDELLFVLPARGSA